jgi:hypothetical protein
VKGVAYMFYCNKSLKRKILAVLCGLCVSGISVFAREIEITVQDGDLEIPL